MYSTSSRSYMNIGMKYFPAAEALFIFFCGFVLSIIYRRETCGIRLSRSAEFSPIPLTF